MRNILFQTFNIILSTLVKADNAPVQIYVNKIKSRIVFKTKTGYKLKSLSPETMKLLGSTKRDVDQNKDGQNVAKLESVKVALVPCHLINNNYQQASKVLFTFVPHKQLEQLITIARYSFTMLKTTNTDFSSIQIWFNYQNSKQLEIEGNVNMELIIGQIL